MLCHDWFLNCRKWLSEKPNFQNNSSPKRKLDALAIQGRNSRVICKSQKKLFPKGKPINNLFSDIIGSTIISAQQTKSRLS
jgi:hypothetical protein